MLFMLRSVQKDVQQSGVLSDEKIKTKMYQNDEHLLDKLETRQVDPCRPVARTHNHTSVCTRTDTRARMHAHMQTHTHTH